MCPFALVHAVADYIPYDLRMLHGECYAALPLCAAQLCSLLLSVSDKATISCVNSGYSVIFHVTAFNSQRAFIQSAAFVI